MDDDDVAFREKQREEQKKLDGKDRTGEDDRRPSLF